MATVRQELEARDIDTPTLQPIGGRTWALALVLAIAGQAYVARALLGGLGAGIALPFAVLAVLVALEPILKRFWRLTRADFIVIYCFVMIVGHSFQLVDRFLPAYTVPLYFATPEDNLERLANETIPAWFVPKDKEIIRQYYEGAEGPIPWRPWVKPLALWLCFFMVLWATLFCLVAIFRRQWTEHEHLAFPLVTVPLYIAATGTSRFRPRKTIWHEPLMWLGFAISFLHFLSIMFHATNPSFPTLGTHYDLGKFFTEKPLDALRPLFLFIYNPHLAGCAYFAPQDLCFSMWFFFVGYFKPIQLVYRVAGWPQPSGFPFYWEQSAGAFIAIALFYAWAARGYLQRVWQAAWAGGWPPGEPPEKRWAEPLSYRVAALGALAGLGFLCAWYVAAGMSFWVALLFFVQILLYALIFTRGRAETGVASTASYPFWQASRQLKSFLGSDALMRGDKYNNLALLGSLIFLHFGDYPEGMTYQIESLRLGEETRVKTSHITALIFVAMLAGLILHFVIFLQMAYTWGANTLSGGTTAGGYGVSISRAEWLEVSRIVDGNKLLPDWNRNGWTIAAFAITWLLIFLRGRFPRSPFHPLGFVMTMSYGYAYWGSYFAIWLFKAIILRLGGARLYHRLAPLFIGLVLGQIFALSIVWQLWALFMTDEWKMRADPLIYF